MENGIQAVQLRCYSPTEIRRLSCLQVTTADGLDVFHNPLPNGVYDERMGSVNDRTSLCRTCGLGYDDCPGHFGHYELTFPYYSPLFVHELVSLLNMTCVFCCRLVVTDKVSSAFCEMRRKLREGLVVDALSLSDEVFGIGATAKRKKKKKNDDDDFDDFVFDPKRRSESGRGDIDVSDDEDGGLKSSRLTNPLLHQLASEMSITFSRLCRSQSSCKHCSFPRFKWSLDSTQGSVISLRGKLSSEMVRRQVRCESFHEITSQIADLGTALEEAMDESVGADTGGRKRKRKLKGAEANVRIEMHPRRVFDFVGKLCQGVDWKVLKWLYGLGLGEATESSSSVTSVAVGGGGVRDSGDDSEAEEEGEVSSDAETHQTQTMQIRSDAELEMFRSLFFLEVLLICSNRFRTPDFLNGDPSVDGLTSWLQGIIRRDMELRELVGQLGRSDVQLSTPALIRKTSQIQQNLAAMMLGGPSLPATFAGIRSQIDKKSGLIRQNMMGKRVNFSARSVILPDPCIFSSEVAIPLFFAQTLTIPVKVHHGNCHEMAELVARGPFDYPGANYVEDINGRKVDLSRRSVNLHSLSNRLLKDGFVVVHRHLQDGDVVLMNRQPTLHRPSVLAHRVRIVWSTHRSLRFHYANCQSYNADFDGDEMNMHAPQDIMARTEAASIMLGSEQYLSPTSGDPLRGLIQDYVVASVLMTKKDSFFSRDDYMQLVYASLHFLEVEGAGARDIVTVAPAILRPKCLWTGKQIVSTLLLNLGASDINLENTTKIHRDRWGDYDDEYLLRIRNGRIVTGVVDKNQIGSRKGGLVHAVYECCGSAVCDHFLSALSWCLKEYLQFSGFTCGLDDGLLKKSHRVKRKRSLEKLVNETVPRAVELFIPRSGKSSLRDVIHDPRESKKLDFFAKGCLNKATSSLLQRTLKTGMQKPFPENHLTLMTESGAKGTVVNVGQISCCLGQQLFEGRRVEYNKRTGKTLPCFLPYETTARSNGYVSSRFLSGIRPNEFFFHCQAGRDGLIDTAIKTSKSGYLQRSLVKSLELLSVAYDQTVRDAFGTIVEFQYGGDGIDVARCGMLRDFSFLARNADSLRRRFPGEPDVDPDADADMADVEEVGSKYQEELDDYVRSNPDQLIRTSRQEGGIVSESSLRYLARRRLEDSLVEPGEAVGVIAAQGLGEPSTQMTLDTFHYAGVEEAHVTQGIPRLTSLLMRGTESSVVTCVPLLESQARKHVNLFLATTTFRDYVQNVSVDEEVGRFGDSSDDRPFDLRYTVLTRFDADSLKKDFGFSGQSIRSFCRMFADNLAKKVVRAAEGKVFRASRNATAQDLQDSALESILRRGDDVDGDAVMEEEEGEGKAADDELDAGDSFAREIRMSVTRGLVRFYVSVGLGLIRVDVSSAAMSVAEQIVIRKHQRLSRVTFPKKSLYGKDETLCVQTEGFDHLPLWRLYDYLDLGNLWTNDVRAFSEIYGIEAGRQLCEDEIVGVFANHGVSVDIRHIRLICDFMFVLGSYNPCNRHSKRWIPSVLNRSTFETATTFLKDAALIGENDAVVDVSGRIMLGRLSNQGTGSFDVMVNIGALLARQDRMREQVVAHDVGEEDFQNWGSNDEETESFFPDESGDVDGTSYDYPEVPELPMEEGEGEGEDYQGEDWDDQF